MPVHLRRSRSAAPATPRTPRILCGVVHYFGTSGSAFVGRSTTSKAEDRLAKVTQVLDKLRALPFEVDVKVYGLPGSSLVDVDVDLTGVVDPRHLVYAALESIVRSAGDYDYVLCVEDDILVEAPAVERMVRFAERNRINEILLPNRIEIGEGGVAYGVDSFAMPGWRPLRRSFESLELSVANNPHSGIAFLSAAQATYAANRVDLARREEYVGGYMASAFAHLHEPFLLWRTTDVHAHQVRHLDHWRSGITLRVGGTPEERLSTGSDRQGGIDDLTFTGLCATITGWAAAPDGHALSPRALAVGGVEVTPIRVSTVPRPDVAAAFGTVSADAGFAITFNLLDLTPEQSAGHRFTVKADDLELSGAWMREAAVWLRANAPDVAAEPDLPAAAAGRLRELAGAATSIVAYGLGPAVLRCATDTDVRLYAVDSRVSHVAALEHRLRALRTGDQDVLIHADLGPITPDGYPLHVPAGSAGADYVAEPWRRAAADGANPEVVLLAGRYRVAGIATALLRAAPGTRILVDGYGTHPDPAAIAAVEAVVTPEARYESAAEIVVPEDVDREAAWDLLSRYAGDPR